MKLRINSLLLNMFFQKKMTCRKDPTTQIELWRGMFINSMHTRGEVESPISCKIPLHKLFFKLRRYTHSTGLWGDLCIANANYFQELINIGVLSLSKCNQTWSGTPWVSKGLAGMPASWMKGCPCLWGCSSLGWVVHMGYHSSLAQRWVRQQLALFVGCGPWSLNPVQRYP